jgi:hypothetical protein
MSYENLPLVSLIALAVAGCGAPSDPASQSISAPLTAPGAVRALVALADPASPAGAGISADEAQGYTARIAGFAGDESVDALAVLARFDDPVSAPQKGPLTLALRRHVDGLRISGARVGGLTITACDGHGVTATFDPRSAPIARATLVYSGDAWATAHAADLVPAADGLLRAPLPGVDPGATITFAIALAQPGGDVAWLNNPRENRPGATGHVDFRQAVDHCEPSVAPATPPLARLVRAFALDDSLGGAAVTSDEVSWLVAQATYEGGTGIDDPDAIDPAVAALDAMNASGVAFEGGAYSIARNFLSQMRMRVAASDVVRVQRAPNQYIYATAPLGAEFMRIYYATDGWSSPKVAECTPTGRIGIVSCGLGFWPADTFVSYAAIVRYRTGGDQIVRASDGGNLFGKVR